MIYIYIYMYYHILLISPDLYPSYMQLQWKSHCGSWDPSSRRNRKRHPMQSWAPGGFVFSCLNLGWSEMCGTGSPLNFGFPSDSYSNPWDPCMLYMVTLCNIYHQFAPNVSIFFPYMDPMGNDLMPLFTLGSWFHQLKLSKSSNLKFHVTREIHETVSTKGRFPKSRGLPRNWNNHGDLGIPKDFRKPQITRDFFSLKRPHRSTYSSAGVWRNKAHNRYTTYIWRFPEIGLPPNHPF